MRILIKINIFTYDEYVYKTYSGYYYVNCFYTYLNKDIFNFDLFNDSSLIDVYSKKYYIYTPDLFY
jgi:hypothetical protein